jgi:hypothetical protein
MRRCAALVMFMVLAPCAACGTNANGTDICQKIEEARCRRAPGCGIALQPPYTTTGTDAPAQVDECVRYYDVACLHGLQVGNPADSLVTGCVGAIQMGACSVVSSPETDPACSWLVPPAAPPAPEASADATGDDSSADAATE